MSNIDTREYENLLDSLDYVNEDNKEDTLLQIKNKKLVLTEFETLYDEIFDKKTIDEKDLLTEMKGKKFTKEEKAALYHRLIIAMIRSGRLTMDTFRPIVEKAMTYDEKHHYDFALIPLLLDFYDGKDDIVKESLKTLPENAITILLKGYYAKEDNKTVMDRIFDYDSITYLVFTTPETSRYMNNDVRDVLSLNTAFIDMDSFVLANTYKVLINGLICSAKDFMSAYSRHDALYKIMDNATPAFEDRFSKEVIGLARFGSQDVMSLMDCGLYDATGDIDGILDDPCMMEDFGHKITKEELAKSLTEADKYRLARFEDSWVKFPFFGMIFLYHYFETTDQVKEIFKQVQPGELPYYKIDFNMTQPKGAIKRQFLVRYDMNLYDLCREFLYSIGVDEIDHQCGFMTKKTRYDCPYPTFFGNDEPQRGMVDASNIRPYEMDSNTALFTYDYIQNWDFKMTISDSPISRKDVGSCVLTKAKGYRLIPDAHNVFYAFYNGEKPDAFFNPFLKDEKGKLISRDVFFGPFKPEEVIRVPHCYYEDDEEDGDEGADEEESQE